MGLTKEQLEQEIRTLKNLFRLLSIKSLGFILVEDDLKLLPERYRI